MSPDFFRSVFYFFLGGLSMAVLIVSGFSRLV